MTKNLHYFNPGHETAVHNGSSYYMPPSNVVKMQQDLEYLPAWYTDSKDYILTKTDLRNFRKYWLENNLKLAQSVILEELSTVSPDFKVFPWGLSPQIIHFFDETSKSFNIECKIPRWNKVLTDLTSRENSKSILQNISSSLVELDNNIIPVSFSSLPDIENYIHKSKYQLLAKSPFSSSGRGLLWLPIGHLTQTEKQILHGMIKKQGRVFIEKALNKYIDFAMEFYITKEGDITFVGYSLFETTTRGAYLGNILDSQTNIQRRITSAIDHNLLELVKINLQKILKDRFSTVYSGYIGVDMMIYEDNGKYKLHPCLEINVRTNMGIIAINIYNEYLHPDSIGMFYIDFISEEEGIYKSDMELNEKYPAIISDGKIKSGYLSLCPINDNTKYRAYILIEERL